MKQAVSGQSGKYRKDITSGQCTSTCARLTSLFTCHLFATAPEQHSCSDMSANLGTERGSQHWQGDLSTDRAAIRRTNRSPGYLGHRESKLDADCLAEFKNHILLACVCKLCQNCRERRASDNLQATAPWLASLVASHELIFETGCFKLTT